MAKWLKKMAKNKKQTFTLEGEYPTVLNGALGFISRVKVSFEMTTEEMAK